MCSKYRQVEKDHVGHFTHINYNYYNDSISISPILLWVRVTLTLMFRSPPQFTLRVGVCCIQAFRCDSRAMRFPPLLLPHTYVKVLGRGKYWCFARKPLVEL